MICSWLDVERVAGSFFWEQAGFMLDDFNFILCHFKKKYVGPTSLTNLFKTKIIHQKTPNGLDVYIIDYLLIGYIPKRINIYLHKRSTKKFYKLLVKSNLKLELIHAQSIFNAGLEAFYLNELTNIPYIFTEHNQFSLRRKGAQELKILQKIIDGNYPKLVVSYDKIRQFAANRLFADFTVVGNGVDETIFNFNASDCKNINQNKELTITTIGAYDPIKDQETILKAFKVIDSKLNEKITFIWGGFNGWRQDNEKQVQILINKFEFKNINVVLIPYLQREEIALTFRKSDLFLFSSISEGMPVSVLEALACGLPVCTTRCGGVDEVINSLNGEIVQIKDYKAIADFLLKFINKEVRYDQLNISKNVLENYSSKAFGKRMKKIYLETIAND